jgi:FMN phosphatase YigB (HAD superfamily)
MIGDAVEVDILGAINAGWDTVYYNPNNLPHNRTPTYEIKSLEELLKIF